MLHYLLFGVYGVIKIFMREKILQVSVPEKILRAPVRTLKKNLDAIMIIRSRM